MSAEEKAVWRRFGLMYQSCPTYGKRSYSMTVADAVFRKLKMKQGDRLIDYGCGRGEASEWFAGKGLDVTGIDVTPAGLSFPAGLPFEFPQSCLWSLPDSIGAADWAFCSDVLAHLPDDRVDKVLGDIAARTTRGGFFAVALWRDNLGPRLIGEKLHLSIHPADWWINKIAAHFRVTQHWQDLEGVRISIFVEK